MVCYESWKLNEYEKNYLRYDLNLPLIIHALNMWRHYLLGRRLSLISDHIKLRYLCDQPNLNAKKARWFATFSEFKFQIRYIKGRENMVADALNRKV